jgi:protoporphyrinogen IX oxidase
MGFYLWAKALHIIGIIAWFAGIFYIWRLFVYHSETNSQEVKDTLAIMERKLYKIIMQPAMVFSLFFGFLMYYLNFEYLSRAGWMWTKLILVVGVLYTHFLAEWYRNQLLKGKTYASKKFRILNEVPTILLIIIVILVVIKPF